MTESRAEYFRKRREDMKNISVYIEKEKAEKLENKLRVKKMSKTEWLSDLVDEELRIDKKRTFFCPYCNHEEEIDFSNATIGYYEREMGEEILYQFNDESFKCIECGKEYEVHGQISEYPIGVLNHEEINVMPKKNKITVAPRPKFATVIIH